LGVVSLAIDFIS